MANLAKYKISECGHLCAHYERTAETYSNEDIDITRTASNYNLAPDRPVKQTEYIRQQLNTIHHSNRKDLVCMASWIINVPDTLAIELHQDFLKESYNFLIDRYGTKSGMGENVCISCYVHTDESSQNPHMHFAFLPVTLDKIHGQKFCAKECIDRNDLRTFHTDLQNYLETKNLRVDVLNGKTQKDSYGRALSVKELKKRDRQINYQIGRW